MGYCSHDPGAALIRFSNKKIDYIFSEEGFLSRKKKSYHFPIRSIQYCLSHYGIKINEVDKFVIDYMDHKRSFRTSDTYRLLAGDYIRSRIKIPKKKISFIESHHLAHAYTAFYPSGMKEATVIVIDGLGSEQQTHSVYHASLKKGIKLLYEQKGTGIGLLYTKITETLGFGKGEEGKTMGLAPYGLKYKSLDKEIPSFRGDLYKLSTDYSNQITRAPDVNLKLDLKKCLNKSDIYKPYNTRIAFKLQEETERCIIHLVKEAIKITGCPNICLAGGVALNCVANSKIQELKVVKNLFVQPASGDTGIPIGLAMYGMDKLINNFPLYMSKKDSIEKFASPYSIDQYPMEKNIGNRFNKLVKKHKLKGANLSYKRIAKYISQKKIISLFHKGIELGPRALGHRSFIADARTSNMKEIMNKKIKHREGYRPFAPIVLKEHFNKYFKSSTNNHPYMLQAPKCRKIALKEVPAVVHVDNTARVQTIDKSAGPIFDILKEYFKLTGTPIVINTSFNDNDEPIVMNKIDALCCFGRTNADVLIINDKYYLRNNIKNIKSFIKDCQNEQKKFQDEFFTKSIINNTSIKNKKSKYNLENFLKFNLNISNHNRIENLQNRLIKFIYNRDTSRILFLDTYHYKIVNKLINLCGSSFKELIPKFKIIQDKESSIKYVTKKSDILMYNISSIIYNNFVKNKLNDLKLFYEMNDMILNLPKYENRGSDINSLDALKNSYENNNLKSIDSLFSKFYK